MKNAKLTLICCSFFLQACVGINNVPMTAEKHEAINSVEVFNLVLQDEMRPYFDVSQISVATGGGLLFAMIDAASNKGRSKTAFELMTPFYNSTQDVDFRVVIAPVINKDLTSRYRLKNQKAVADSVLLARKKLQDRVKALAPGETLLYLSTEYSFINQAKTLQTVTSARIFIGGMDHVISNNEPKPDYQNLFLYNSELIGDGDTQSLDLWRSNEGALYQEMLEKSAAITAQMLLYDLQFTRNEDCHARVSASGFNLIAKQKASGVLIRHADNRALIRDSSSKNLFSMPTSALAPNDQSKTSQICAPQ